MSGYTQPEEAPSSRGQTPSDKLISTGDNSERVVCYYHNAAARRPGKGRLAPDQIDLLLCTHLIYSHLAVSEHGEVKSHDEELDLGASGGLGLKRHPRDIYFYLDR